MNKAKTLEYLFFLYLKNRQYFPILMEMHSKNDICNTSRNSSIKYSTPVLHYSSTSNGPLSTKFFFEYYEYVCRS